MPELPEVEVVKKSLKKRINKLKFTNVSIINKKLRYEIDKRYIKKIIGHNINNIKRRSKNIILNLDNGESIIFHLGMTGKLTIIDEKKKIIKTSFSYDQDKLDEKHNHVIFFMNKGIKLIYNDVRKFGYIKIIKTNNINQSNHFNKLGPEPFAKSFNFEYFKKIKKKRQNIKIKDLLMDQKFIAGLGNIYVNEILFFCKINPKKKVRNLTKKDMANIIKFSRSVLKKAIQSGGSSIKDFSSSDGKSGKFQLFFNVYGKHGKNCSRRGCRATIQRVKISNRSTFFCNLCQKY